MRRPCIIYWGDHVYSLDDGPPVLLGDQQDEVLQLFLDKKLEALPTKPEKEFLKHYHNPASPYALVALTTEEVRWQSTRNLSSVMTALKRGPLGAAIDLPGKGRKGRGYRVRIAVKATPQVEI
jgi:hypothetical protein